MISDILLIENLNKELADQYRVLDGRPIYRIVWSGDQLEVRRGKMTEFYGHIFLREYWTVGQRPKYWYFQNPCWVLEKLTFIKGRQALEEIVQELVECANGSYEPIFPFVDKDFKALPVAPSVVKTVIWKLQNPTKPLTPSELEDLRIKLEDAEVKYFEEEIGKGERAPLFVANNSVFVSTNQIGFNKTYKQEYKER